MCSSDLSPTIPICFCGPDGPGPRWAPLGGTTTQDRRLAGRGPFQTRGSPECGPALSTPRPVEPKAAGGRGGPDRMITGPGAPVPSRSGGASPRATLSPGGSTAGAIRAYGRAAKAAPAAGTGTMGRAWHTPRTSRGSGNETKHCRKHSSVPTEGHSRSLATAVQTFLMRHLF